MNTRARNLQRNYIAGKWVDAKGRATFPNHDPATGELIGRYPASMPEDVGLAVAAAKTAFPTWRRFPAPRRAEILFRAGEMMVQRKEELARAMTREMGKVIDESRGDVQEAIDLTYYFAGEGRRLFGVTTPSESKSKMVYSIRVPLGVVGAISPFNFPFAIPVLKAMPALIAGNTVVVKPAEDTPHMANMVAEILEAAGLPTGVFNVGHGAGAL